MYNMSIKYIILIIKNMGGIMKSFRLNYELSQEVYNRNKDSININECYRNVFNVTASLPQEINMRDARIMYCMLYREDTNMFNRHCCILYQDTVIDPTAPLWKSAKNSFHMFRYYIINTYTSEQHLDILDLNNGHLEFFEELLEEEIKIHNALIRKNYARNFGELGEFLERVYKKNLGTGILEYQNNQGIIKI